MDAPSLVMVIMGCLNGLVLFYDSWQHCFHRLSGWTDSFDAVRSFAILKSAVSVHDGNTQIHAFRQS